MEHTWISFTSMVSGACFAFIATIFAARRGMVEKGTCQECKSNLSTSIHELKGDMKEVKDTLKGIETSIAVIKTRLNSFACGDTKC